MIERGQGEYANPASMIKASAMLLRHICRTEAAERLEKAMDACDVVVSRYIPGATGANYTNALLKLL